MVLLAFCVGAFNHFGEMESPDGGTGAACNVKFADVLLMLSNLP
jgi:hypothetical protein